MKNYLIVILFVVLGSTQTMGQYYDYYEWGEDYYKKKKYDKAEKYLYKAIESCSGSDVKAACWLYLMDIYQNGKVNDSLYMISKKALVRNGYESPNYKIVYIGIDPDIYIPEIPEIDLYYTGRELVCELYDRKEYDSALFYFNNYARKFHEKGWCGFGKENNYLYDIIIGSRLAAATGDTVEAFRWIKYFLTPGPDLYHEQPDYHLVMYCFYNNIQTLYPEYGRGDILNELIEHLHYGSFSDGVMNFCTSFRGNSFYFHEQWKPGLLETRKDTLKAMDSIFHQTRLYKTIELKDQLKYDTLVTISGSLSFGTGKVTIFSNDISFDLDGWNMDNKKEKYIEVTGIMRTEKNPNGFYWNYDSKLVREENSVNRKIKMISYKTLSQ